MKCLTVIVIFLLSSMPSSGNELLGTIAGETAGEQFGSAICMIDFNSDGFSDLTISAPASDENGISSGKVYVFFGGQSADLVADLELLGPADSFFGKSISTAGDFNNDGNEDLLVGAPYYDQPYQNAGAVFLFLGGENPDTDADYTFTGSAAGDYFGISTAGIGDFNNDTYDDIAVGSYKSDWGGSSDAGMVYVYFGGSDPDTEEDKILVGDGDGERFGFSVTGRDFNDNGSSDIAVGAYSYDDVHLNQGRIYIFHGGTSPDSLYDLAISGSDAGNKFGWALSSGNANNDNFPDLVMGTDGFSIDTFETGKMYLFYGGSPMDEYSDKDFSLNNSSDDYLGYSVSSGIDINADGFDEILIGMPGNDDFDSDAGGAVLISGGASLVFETAFYGGTAGEELGNSVGFWKNYGINDDILIILGASSFNEYQGQVYFYNYQMSNNGVCGDANSDLSVNILDITFLISYLYKGGQEPEPLEIADVNSSGNINLLDITYLISYLYKGGPDPQCP